MTRPVGRDRSLEELEGVRRPDPPAGATRLVATVHALCRQPVGALTVEDLRLLIRQDVGLPHLLPLAVGLLHADPMAEGDMYEGDLLTAVLTRDRTVWDAFPELVREVRRLVADLPDAPDLPRPVRRAVQEFSAQ